MKEALLYKKNEDNSVHCFLCNHYCRINEGNYGFCGVRKNIKGTLFSQVYANPVAMHADPVEKKPLYHFLPGSKAFSLATYGCNFRCRFCQNWEISQQSVEKLQVRLDKGEVLPKQIVEAALKNDCRSIAYTYTEPTIYFEYAYETAKLARATGLKNIFVTNGYMTRQCLEMIGPFLDAANVDLKFFRDEAYQKICAGHLQPVLDSIKLMREFDIWVEITTLVVPGENDSDKELSDIARFIASIDKNIPWHISRFHPDYQFGSYPATAQDLLKKAEAIGLKAGLAYIYIGNVLGFGNDTNCPNCGKPVIRREVFNILEYNIKKGKCAFCGQDIPGVF